MNQSELAALLASEQYSEADCLKLLKMREGLRAAEALRVSDSARATELAIRLLELGNSDTEMSVLGRQGTGLLDFPYSTYAQLLGNVPQQRKALVRPLVEWLELGRDRHLDTLRTHYDTVLLGLRGQALPMNPRYLPRLWSFIEPSLHAAGSLEEQVRSVLKAGGWTFMTRAAFHLAEAHGVELASLGACFMHGGRSDVLAHAMKPLQELLFKKSPDAFFDQLDEVTSRVGLVTWQVPWMLDFLAPETQMVQASGERAVVLVADRLVVAVSGIFKKKGRLAVKVHKTAAAAAKDYETRLVAAEKKLGASRMAWDGIAAPSVQEALARGPAEALIEASKSDRLDDVEGLLHRGADANLGVTDAYNRVTTPLNVAKSPGVVQRLLEAGAQTSNALLMMLTKGDSNPDWPYLCQEASIRLIRAGADLKATHRGLTALHMAASSGWLDAVDALLKAGADRNAAAGPEAKVPGQTPLEVAAEARQHLVVARLQATA